MPQIEIPILALPKTRKKLEKSLKKLVTKPKKNLTKKICISNMQIYINSAFRGYDQQCKVNYAIEFSLLVHIYRL